MQMKAAEGGGSIGRVEVRAKALEAFEVSEIREEVNG
jgi:hypothetical protein